MEEQRDKLKQETTEEDTQPEPHPVAAVLWMLGMGRKIDPEELEWK